MRSPSRISGLSCTSKFKYLDHIVKNNFIGGDDIARQTICVYAQAKLLFCFCGSGIHMYPTLLIPRLT